MKKYFIHDGKKQVGPFTALELIEKGITKCTPVYTEGLGRYVKASEIPVLNDSFGKSIEVLKHPISIDTPPEKENTTLKKIAWFVGALLIIIIPYVVYKMQVDVPDVPIANSNNILPNKQNAPVSRTALEHQEASNPLQYLTVHGRMHKNLVGRKIIKGSITNMASVASFKNMEMAITFLTEDQRELQTQQFYINDLVTANNAINFRSVFTAPPETRGFRIKVLAATAMP